MVWKCKFYEKGNVDMNGLCVYLCVRACICTCVRVSFSCECFCDNRGSVGNAPVVEAVL